MRDIYGDNPREHESNSLSTTMYGLIAVLVVVFLILILAGAEHYTSLNQSASAAVPALTAAETSGAKAASPASTDAETQREKDRLINQRMILKELLDVKGRIIDSLAAKLQASGLDYTLDRKTGVIRFNNAYFFKSTEAALQKPGEECLKKFVPVYMSVLLDPVNKKYLNEIVIEGYTDNAGSYTSNLDLSQRRAYNVAMYITGGDFPNYTYKDEVLKYIAANGRSYNDPIMINGVMDKDKSRRVEFRFRLKDDEILEKIRSALDEVEK